MEFWRQSKVAMLGALCSHVGLHTVILLYMFWRWDARCHTLYGLGTEGDCMLGCIKTARPRWLTDANFSPQAVLQHAGYLLLM